MIAVLATLAGALDGRQSCTASMGPPVAACIAAVSASASPVKCTGTNRPHTRHDGRREEIAAGAAHHLGRVGQHRRCDHVHDDLARTDALARRAEDLGIPIRAGQITDSSAVRFLDSTLGKTPGMGYGAANRAQQIAVNRAVAQTIGEDADRLTPAVMQ